MTDNLALGKTTQRTWSGEILFSKDSWPKIMELH